MPDDPPKPKHDHTSLKFPEGFLWGVGISSFQVEGQNFFADWWNAEIKKTPLKQRSGQAANQYHLYESDFDLAKKLNLNAFRLSLEWSRIEPRPGEFDHHEIEHYRKVLKSLKDRNFKVMLTLWHVTLPQWIAEQGGWENSQTVKYYLRYLERVVPEIKDLVDFWITLNEPDIYVFMVYNAKTWPISRNGVLGQIKTYLNLVSAHKKAYKLLHRLSNSPVGVAQNMQSYEGYHKHSLREQAAAIISDLVANHLFHFLTRGYHDFLGVNYYFHHRYKVDKGFLPSMVNVADHLRDVSDMGWEINPEGLFDVLADLENHLPIYITECGIASTNDDRRTRFLIHYLQEVYRSLHAGVKVKGFFYWSLVDSFEWEYGYNSRFGLIEVDFKTQKRIIRSSAHVYEEIIKRNAIPHDLLKLLGHGIRVEDVLKEKIKE
ncbi:glycoside hydrolase family 1 protein [Candidatus Daviesbacteria bacterium]|nr:glycoside hydrolase family 1 protein [Candidatus Daviesbacteria bacterium]